MTSSLRKTIHRRNHKERSQLSHRTKLGILEKHADYVKRARDYHSKQDRLTRLKQKAADRNKDEFYFGMNSEKTKGGVHTRDRGNTALPTDIVKVLKTQDENYVRTMRASNLKKIDKLKAQLTSQLNLLVFPDADDENGLEQKEVEILVDAGILPAKAKKGESSIRSKPKHIVFKSAEDEPLYSGSPEGKQDVPMFSSSTVGLGWKTTQLSKRPGSTPKVNITEELDNSDSPIELSLEFRNRLLKELSARVSRDTHLRYAEREFELQRALMGKGARQKLSAPSKLTNTDEADEEEGLPRRKPQLKASVSLETYKPRVYKWRTERKR